MVNKQGDTNMDKVKEYDVLYAALKAVTGVQDALWASLRDTNSETQLKETATLLTQSMSLQKSLEEAAVKRLPYKMFSDCFPKNLSETEVEAWLAEHDIKCGIMGDKAFCVISNSTASLYGISGI